MDVRVATHQDVPDLARLVWLHAAPDEQARQSVDSFAVDLGEWWTSHDHSHLAFVASDTESGIVGMAWLALLPRVPRPGATDRRSADIQSVFVLLDERGRGIGSALIRAAAEHAQRLGAKRVTVSSSDKAVALYERLGFASVRHLLQMPVD